LLADGGGGRSAVARRAAVTILDAAGLSARPQLPVGRTGTVDELAAMTVYLASEESDFVAGQVLRLNGG
jgi:NAD(P)-dependent dehydrogenase (short-subunit alcohol dehydrogenase family)